jgi:hypothetical protein
METLSGDISARIFRPVIKPHLQDVALESKLLGIFLEMNGTQTLGEVARKTGRNLAEIREAASRLLQLELIEPAEGAASFLDLEFMSDLKSQLSKALGPIAAILIEDEVAERGYSFDRFPVSEAAELVDALAREIQRADKKNEFQKTMVNALRTRGY